MKNLFQSFLRSGLTSSRRPRRARVHRLPQAVQVFEDRTLPAGNVVAVLTGGHLILTGDAADNQVQLSVVSGNLVVQGTSGTTVNGATTAFTVSTGNNRIARDLRVSLGDGNDTFTATGVLILDNVLIDGGSGNDAINLTSLYSGDNISVLGGAGDDGVLMSSVGMDDNLLLDGGDGNDTLSYDQGYVDDYATVLGGAGNDTITFARVYINDSITVNGGDGNDTVVFQNVRSDDDTQVDGGAGDDQIQLTSAFSKDYMRLSGGDGNDNFVLRSTTARRDFRMDTGSGNDTADFGTMTAHDNFFVETGSGDDVIVTNGLNVSDFASFRTGSGNDRVVFQNSTLSGPVHVFTGEGDDFVDVIGSTFRSVGLFVMEGGNDLLVTSGTTSFRGVFIADTGSGTDTVETGGATQFQGGQAVVSAESRDANDTTVDALLNAAGTGALSMTAAIAADLASRFVPIATNDNFTAVNGSLTTTTANGVLVNDTPSAIGGTLTAARVDNVTNGTLTFNANGTFTYIANTSFTGNDTFTYRVTDAFGNQSALATVTIVVQRLPLTLDLSSNDTRQSNGTLVTEDAPFTVAGETQAGATVTIDSDGDGEFDDGSATADSNGDFSIIVTLTHTTTNRGANTLTVRSSFQSQTATESVNVHLAEGTVVRFSTSLGSFDVELLDTAAPQTVAAFLANLSRYDNSIIHRNDDDFVIQGGGFTVSDLGVIGNVQAFTAPPNEFTAANSNVRGTLSTAQIGGNINSFTGQWFVNTSNTNSFLDSVPHTVFGRVIGTGMTVVDAINNVPVFNRTDLNGAFGELPLRNFTSGTPVPGNYVFAPIGRLFTT